MAKKFKKSGRKRARLLVRVHKPAVAPSGARPEAGPAAPKFNAFRYTAERMEEFSLPRASDARALVEPNSILWLHAIGVENAAAINELGEAFGLHPLALEDAVNVHQRPKSEDYEDHVFLVLRIPEWERQQLVFEQISFFVGANYVITILEQADECLAPVFPRLRSTRSRIRQRGPDYLVYALIDAVLDSYYPIVERYNDRLEELENDIVSKKTTDHIAEIHAIRHELHMLRRTLLPTREALSNLVRNEVGLIQPETNVFLRDCQDHTAQLLDAIESCQGLSSSLIDLHLSSVTAYTNEIMKVLTLISTIFIPLSFIASLYGMNFDRAASPWNMPELGWTFGYPLTLGAMAILASALLLFFRRHGWIGKVKNSSEASGVVSAQDETPPATR